MFVPPLLRETAETQRIVTAVGEQRDVMLVDGSTLHVNTDTALTVTLGGKERSVQLDKGEVLFDVTYDAARPFDISAGDRRVRVVVT